MEEKEKIKTSEHYINEILRTRLRKAKSRAIKLNKEFNLTFDYIKKVYLKQKGLCNITQLELTFTIGEGRTNTNISLDRIDSSKGYIKGNIQLICSVVNMMKGELTLEDLKYYCNKILENHEK